MSPAAATAVERLACIVGAEHLFTDAAHLAGYNVDGVQPSAVARPANAAETAEVVRFAAAEKLALVPCGARTKLGIGMPPARYDLALDMTRLNRMVAYDPGDLTLSVEAGLPLAELTGVLAERRQMLPLAVPFTSKTTVGGTIASGVDSPLRQFYGTARDYVLGIEFITGEGTAAKSGGRVVKNVAGYDLHKLMVGSLGTLGVITRVNFRTFPLPPASRGFLATFPKFPAALELRHKIASSKLQPLTLEILSPELAQIFAARTPRFLPGECPAPGTWFSTACWTLAAGFGGSPEVLERYETELKRMAAEMEARASVVLDDSTRPLVWGRLRECLSLMLDSSSAATIVKIGVMPTMLRDLLDRIRAIAEMNELPQAMLVRGVGVVYAALLPRAADEETLARLAVACQELFALAQSAGGHAMIEFCPAELKRRVNVWGAPRGDFEMMRRVKQAFDPHGILSPGRFVGGL